MNRRVFVLGALGCAIPKTSELTCYERREIVRETLCRRGRCRVVKRRVMVTYCLVPPVYEDL